MNSDVEPACIFVYGTLRKETASSMHAVLARHSAYLSDGHMQGSLYEVGGYPGAIPSADTRDRVYGEVFRLVDKQLVLARLDAYEGCTDAFPEPHEYVRQAIPVTLTDGDSVTAWVYLYNHTVSGLEHIPSGNYLTYLRAKRPG